MTAGPNQMSSRSGHSPQSQAGIDETTSGSVEHIAIESLMRAYGTRSWDAEILYHEFYSVLTSLTENAETFGPWLFVAFDTRKVNKLRWSETFVGLIALLARDVEVSSRVSGSTLTPAFCFTGEIRMCFVPSGGPRWHPSPCRAGGFRMLSESGSSASAYRHGDSAISKPHHGGGTSDRDETS